MAKAMEEACANDNIGYDQGTQGNASDRVSLYQALRKNGFNMAKVNVKCETDCSSLVACCANCAGVAISPDIYTGNEQSAFKQTGLFEFHTESKYLTSDKYLPRGAVLLYEGHHTAINLTEHGVTLKQGWEKVGSNKYYYRDGKKLIKEWVKDTDNCWYRLGNSGEMLTGLRQIYDSKGKLRYAAFDDQGRMLHEAADKEGYLEVWYDTRK